MPRPSATPQGPSASAHALDRRSRITIGVAAATWLGCWLAGNLAGGAIFALAGREGGTADTPIWVTLIGAVGLWIPMLIGLHLASEHFGVHGLRHEFGLSFRPFDLLGVPIGVFSQLVLVRLLYWPLERIWPDTFARTKIEESARRLYDSADGAWLLALIVLVVVGAPVIEELLYRGLLQGAFRRRFNGAVAVGVVAVWFGVIHFRPVEYPGLILVGLVFGACALVTDRIGMSIVAHAAFNATGLAWIATR